MSPKRLLILDDDLLVGQTVAFVADTMGFETRLTSSADAFFAALDAWVPTHISTDLVMPDMDGVEVMRLLATRGCQARIIISSGVDSKILDAARRSAAEAGLDIVGVLAKPFLPGALRALLAAPARDPAGSTVRASVAKGSFEVTESALCQALERREFHLVYQPKINCRSGELAGLEALVRWQHPVAGLVMPDQFIAAAERWKLIDALTLQVLDEALRWLSQSCLAPETSISVNISSQSLVDFQLVDLAFGLCNELSIEPSRVIFELTESTTMADPSAALGLLARLRMKGFQLSIDDFGTGFSSMVQLVRMPFSEIKVDKSFVMAVRSSQEARTVTKSVVDLGHSLGLMVTAEGVEDQHVLDFLNTIGCDFAQGYFIARPMVAGRVAEWVAGRRAH